MVCPWGPGLGEIPPHVCRARRGRGTEGADPRPGGAECGAGAGKRIATCPGQPGAAGPAAILGASAARAICTQWTFRLSLLPLTMCLRRGGCRWLPGPGPAAGLLLLCSFNARTQPQHPGMGVEGSLLACPFPPGLPRVPRPFRKRENPGLGTCLELLIHGRTQHHLLPWVSVFWGPSPAPPAIDGLERFGGSLAGPTPTPPCPLQAPPLLCPGEGVWTVSSTSGIQVVIKIIIIIKKSEET